MNDLVRIAFLGNHLPRRCGIATFTHDLHRAVASSRSDLQTCVVAMSDSNSNYAYPSCVKIQVRDDVLIDCRKAAAFLNNGNFDVVCLQHEYGIFGGEAGADILELLRSLKVPLVTTLHTILAAPSLTQRRVMNQIIDASAKLIVMSDKGRATLRATHDVPAAKVVVIPHGIPEYHFVEPLQGKRQFGFADKSIVLTFGLLAPSKGIETVIDAMPDVIKSCPNAVYVVLGATHPNLVRAQGEAYRESLMQRAEERNVSNHVVFLNQFVDQAKLLDYISMCDVYVTPYLNEAQMTSGTLAYSFGLGKAVVSTPYWHAQELLADGRGVLVPFGDVSAIGAQISSLLTNDVRRHAMRKRAYAASRSMIWSQVAKDYLAVFQEACGTDSPDSGRHRGMIHEPNEDRSLEPFSIPALKTRHFVSMCDSTGLIQHAVHSIPDRSHGYCVDDNARALLLACRLAHEGETHLSDDLTARFAAFIQHAWNEDTRRFRNFMSYERSWLEASGSEDSHGRTLWALGECAATDTDASRRNWALSLFKAAVASVEGFSSPRAWAFTLLGLGPYCATIVDEPVADRLRRVLANRLMSLLSVNTTEDWHWFENVLAYDNARLPQALIETGLATRNDAYVEAGLASLRWLMAQQTTSSGCFRPVGSNSFGRIRARPELFDQQPIEAAATIAACLSAARADDDPVWPAWAMSAFTWFHGANDLQVPLVDLSTGGCFDGLHSDRPNRNMGAESVLSYMLAQVDIGQSRLVGALAGKSVISPLLAHSA